MKRFSCKRKNINGYKTYTQETLYTYNKIIEKLISSKHKPNSYQSLLWNFALHICTHSFIYKQNQRVDLWERERDSLAKERERESERDRPHCYYWFKRRWAATRNGDHRVRIFSLLGIPLIHMEEESLKRRCFTVFFLFFSFF